MSESSIVIRGAREHNLRDIDLTIPRDQLVVITGLSGSGKSSLAFDTIYAEGQRRYVESLSSYARQFLGQMDKPDLDSIDGLSPAVSIDQKTTSKNPRSTVGTVTEIYDYLRLLFARIGIPHCPVCGRVIERQTTDQVADKILAAGQGRRAYMLAPAVIGRKGEFTKLLDDLRAEGFSRVRVDGEVRSLDDEIELDKKFKHTIEVVVDRIVIRPDSSGRIAEAVEQATRLAHGNVGVYLLADRGAPEGTEGDLLRYSLALACPEHGHSIDDLQPRDFSFNAPYGACPECDGLGFKKVVDAEALIEDPSLSIEQGVFGSFFGKSNYYPQIFLALCRHLKADPSAPWCELPARVRKIFLDGLGDVKMRVDYRTQDGRDTHWSTKFSGVRNILYERYIETTNENTKARLERFIRDEPCQACHGARLRPEMLAVTVGGKSIYDVCLMSCNESLAFFETLELSERERYIGGRVVKEIIERLRFLVNVGLDYLTLARASATLSGGEAQRIRLATQIGAGLMGVLYILDEPSIGLHQRDNARLIETLERLRDIGNTVIVVEHDEDTIRAADYVVDMGPGAGENGGEVVCAGTPADIMACGGSLTGAYLTGKRMVHVPSKRRDPGRGALTITGARANNLRGISASIELGTLTVVTGVSGSGKSSLVTDTIAPALTNAIQRSSRPVGPYRSLEGVAQIDKVIDIDQSPIGRTPRSNPATYIGLWDDLRALFASTPESKARGYAPGRFSFNVAGGRCEACKGDGQIKIEMHFLPDIYVPCEVCHGKRYNRETLEVLYRGRSIADVLDMSVAEALIFFTNIPQVKRKLQTLYDVGLGYVRLGQPATTLSGGEAQRVKLARELHRKQTGKTFYILDEPTTGLHFEDVRQLLDVLERLVDAGNTVLVIEHNLDVIKVADRIIDLGPEGGGGGGRVVVAGTPEQVARSRKSYTGRFLKPVLARDAAREREHVSVESDML
ncbi:Excinuclease ABC subunit A [Coriobacterium glomerans PW2]|uniref:UvrABC system protein A n=1 Tax=Coriobacterium glomerans (strain ATCC 49209 / DSM 20642 / JCM 10262 / PW2) TaxID=700015 RepID=F2N8I6_CORGP|nr:excinuclease ABC subunit UvrA [Coriobacterium glomerans]AEB07369.1 Excinuclease ABC subunit A [Coriobacterium glomerans PW2]